MSDEYLHNVWVWEQRNKSFSLSFHEEREHIWFYFLLVFKFRDKTEKQKCACTGRQEMIPLLQAMLPKILEGRRTRVKILLHAEIRNEPSLN